MNEKIFALDVNMPKTISLMFAHGKKIQMLKFAINTLVMFIYNILSWCITNILLKVFSNFEQKRWCQRYVRQEIKCHTLQSVWLSCIYACPWWLKNKNIPMQRNASSLYTPWNNRGIDISICSLKSCKWIKMLFFMMCLVGWQMFFENT